MLSSSFPSSFHSPYERDPFLIPPMPHAPCPMAHFIVRIVRSLGGCAPPRLPLVNYCLVSVPQSRFRVSQTGPNTPQNLIPIYARGYQYGVLYLGVTLIASPGGREVGLGSGVGVWVWEKMRREQEIYRLEEGSRPHRYYEHRQGPARPPAARVLTVCGGLEL